MELSRGENFTRNLAEILLKFTYRPGPRHRTVGLNNTTVKKHKSITPLTDMVSGPTFCVLCLVTLVKLYFKLSNEISQLKVSYNS